MTENFIFGSIFKQSGSKETIKKTHFMQLEVAKAEVLDVGVVVNAMAGSLSSESRFFDSPKRRLGRRNHPLVDPNHPRLQSLPHPPALSNVSAVEVAGKTCPAVVGDIHRLLLFRELLYRDNWSKDLLLTQLHVRGDPCQDGWLVVKISHRAGLASNNHGCSLFLRLLHHRAHLAVLRLV